MTRTLMVAAALLTALFGMAGSGLLLRAEDDKQADDGTDLAAGRMKSADNLKKIALAVINYADQNQGLVPPSAVLDKDGRPLYGWRVLVLPYLHEEKLYR